MSKEINIAAEILTMMDEDNGIGLIAPSFNPSSQHTFNTWPNRKLLKVAVKVAMDAGWTPSKMEIYDMVCVGDDSDMPYRSNPAYQAIDEALNEIFEKGAE